MSVILSIIILILIIAAFLYSFATGQNNSATQEDGARRFAKLLIAEIKLYENYKVEKGLRENNLYGSLHDEIEKARKMYRKRIINSQHERFFEELLVEILANGDKSKMGQIDSTLK